MTTPFLDDLIDRFLKTYRAQLANNLRVVAEMEDDEYRQELATTDPDKARSLEGHTRDERETRAQELAMALGVAEVVRAALESYNLNR